jgi:hypothetical protein
MQYGGAAMFLAKNELRERITLNYTAINFAERSLISAAAPHFGNYIDVRCFLHNGQGSKAPLLHN